MGLARLSFGAAVHQDWSPLPPKYVVAALGMPAAQVARLMGRSQRLMDIDKLGRRNGRCEVGEGKSLVVMMAVVVESRVVSVNEVVKGTASKSNDDSVAVAGVSGTDNPFKKTLNNCQTTKKSKYFVEKKC